MSARLSRDEETPTNEELVQRFQAGDVEAFGDLWQRLHLRVYRYCYRMLGEKTAAEDATSDAFFKALNALPGLHAVSFQSWLFAIAHNVVIDHMRRSRPIASLDEALDLPDVRLAPDGHGEFVDIAVLLALLSPQQHEVVALRLEGFVTSEIATMIGKSTGSIDQTFYRAMVRLRGLPKGVVRSGQGASHD